MESFGELVKRYREARGLAQRALARDSGINPAIISRMESGDRGPSGPEQVRAISRALQLDEAEADTLLQSAGYWPEVYLTVGPQDQTLLAVARVLAGSDLDEVAKTRFRRVLELLVEQWQTPTSTGARGAAGGGTRRGKAAPAVPAPPSREARA